MLTVSYFMIQHQRYSDPALPRIQEKMSDVLKNGMNSSEIRLQMTYDVDQVKRDWKSNVNQENGNYHTLTGPSPSRINPYKDDPVSYCAWVEKWARATLEEMKSQF